MAANPPNQAALKAQARQQRIDRIAEIFAVDGLPLKGAALDKRLAELNTAAAEEYELAFSASRFPATIKELRELRLTLLYEHLPDGLPTDDQIGQLFQMTRTQVGTLVAGARARFGPAFDERVKREAIATLGNAEKLEDNKIRVMASDSLGRFMNDLLARTQAAPMEKRADANQTYDVTRSTVSALCERLGVNPKSTVKALKWS